MDSAARHSAKPSFLAADLEVTGDIRHAGTLVVQAKVTGNIRAAALTLQQGAEVIGDVEALQAQIYGSVQGFAFIEDVTVGTTGQVIGSLQYKTLSVEAGAILDAEIRKMAPVEVASAEPGPAELAAAEPAAQPSGSATE
jgi:cytoskeletal protein CcmA (bactofilin family)